MPLHTHNPPPVSYPVPNWETIYGEIKKNTMDAPPADDPIWDDPDGYIPPMPTYMVTIDVDDQFGENHYVRVWITEDMQQESHFWDFILTELTCSLEEKFA